MKITITIDDDLLDDVRRQAAERRQTVIEVIQESVRESLLRRREAGREPFRLRTFYGGGYQPGLDLDDNASVLDLMDQSP